MIDPKDATEKVAFILLTQDGELGAPVYQDVPDNTPPPVVIIGDITFEPLPGLKDDVDGRGTLEIVTIVQGDERKPIFPLQKGIKDRLRGAKVVEDGWRIKFNFTGDSAQLDETGTNYVGFSRFDFLALRA